MESPQAAESCTPAKKGKTTYKGITSLERERRIDFAANVLLTFHRRSEQIGAICKEFDIQWRQASDYLKYARQRTLAATQKTREEHLAEAIEFYESVIHNPVYDMKHRLQARKLLDRAVGIGMAAPGAESTTLIQIDTVIVNRPPLEESEPARVVTLPLNGKQEVA